MAARDLAALFRRADRLPAGPGRLDVAAEIGRLLASWRTLAGLTQPQAAEWIGADWQTWAHWEQGRQVPQGRRVRAELAAKINLKKADFPLDGGRCWG